MMPALYLTFTRNYDWSPQQYRNASVVHFRAGETHQVTRPQAAAALGAKAARQATTKEIDDARRRRAQ
jgi:hypothetical protein